MDQCRPRRWLAQADDVRGLRSRRKRLFYEKRKARIEVIDVQDHMSEARILEDSPANPIISGDVIETPAWTPGQHIHFALALKMDINKDGVDDYDLVRNVILMNGGVIDAELRPDGTRIGNIDANTRYFVVGQRPDENTSSDTLKKFITFEQDRQNFSVKKIQVNELLGLMGWKSEERTRRARRPARRRYWVSRIAKESRHSCRRRRRARREYSSSNHRPLWRSSRCSARPPLLLLIRLLRPHLPLQILSLRSRAADRVTTDS